MSIELVMPSNHLILCHPLLLLPSTFPSIRVFSIESVLRIRWPKCWSFSFSISPFSEYSGLISFRMEWLDLAVQGTLKKSSPPPQFKSINSLVLLNVVLEKTLESPLDCKEIQLVHPKGDQSCVFIVRTDTKAETPIFEADSFEDTLMLGKIEGRRRRGQQDKMVRWHHQFNGHKFE